MAEYIKREEALNKLLQCADDYDPHCSDITVAHAMSKIKEIPEADVVEVVRCKDCLSWKKDAYGGVCDRYGVRLDGDWFCAGGEKKEVQDDD